MLWGLATFVFLSPSLRAVLGNPVRMLTHSHGAFQGANKLQSPDKEEVLTVQSHLAAGNALCSNALRFYKHLFLACYYLLALLRWVPIPLWASLSPSVVGGWADLAVLWAHFQFGCCNRVSYTSSLCGNWFVCQPCNHSDLRRCSGAPEPPLFRSPKIVAWATKSCFSLSKSVGVNFFFLKKESEIHRQNLKS